MVTHVLTIPIPINENNAYDVIRTVAELADLYPEAIHVEDALRVTVTSGEAYEHLKAAMIRNAPLQVTGPWWHNAPQKKFFNDHAHSRL